MFRKGNKSNTNNSVIQTADTHRSQQALAELVQILFNQPLLTILLLQTIGPAIVVAYFWDSVPQTTLLSWMI